ncbi:MAG: hypothetical protein ACREMF_11765 [Gemmatimonadales bacterium]
MRVLTQRLLLVALAGVLLSSTAAAQRRASGQSARPSLGPQVGFATSNFDFFIGAQFSYPVASQFDIYPSFVIFFPGNNVTAWALNADVRYWPRLNTPNPGLYLGGGLNVTHASVSVPGVGSASASDAGLGLLGGWEFKAVQVRPFAQLRIVIGDADRIEFGGGINFRL